MKKNKGITLIALIVTIIILLILAGITINFMLGDNGILNRAKNAGATYEEQAAREKLEIALADLVADKITDTEYNENEYIDNTLIEQNMIVNGDIVTVDGWQFEIDRSVPQISASLGKGESNGQIKLVVSQTVSSDYVKSTIKVEIEYIGEISFIQIAGEEIALPEKKDGKYIVEKEIIANGNYSVLVKDKEEKYQIGSIKVSDITEDMDIWTKADMELFRDQVNSGRTYEGRTVKVMADINLEGNEQNQWIPIGTDTTNFKGKFEGNYYTISNLYINSTESSLGLFKKLEGARVEKLKIENINIHTTGSTIGTIAAVCTKNVQIYQIWIKNGNMYAQTNVGGIVGVNQNNSTIQECINNANIAIRNIQEGDWIAGGIVGSNEANIYHSYNTGNITGYSYLGGICGYNRGGNIDNSYNIANIQGWIMVAGITADLGYGNTGGSINNCYHLSLATISANSYKGDIYGNKFSGTITSSSSISAETLKNYATNLGDVWKEDEMNINNGYPILKWQLEK